VSRGAAASISTATTATLRWPRPVRGRDREVTCNRHYLGNSPAARARLRRSNSSCDLGEFEDEKDVALDPELEIADGEQAAFGLLPFPLQSSLKQAARCLFLLRGLELRQQKGVADADLLAVERLHDHGALEASSDITSISMNASINGSGRHMRAIVLKLSYVLRYGSGTTSPLGVNLRFH